jgi:hypothetical protein
MPLDLTEVPRAHWEKICARWQAGDSQKAIGEDHGVPVKTIKAILIELNAYERKPKPKVASGTDVKAFRGAARSILWSHDGGTDHSTYEKWEQRVKDLRSKDGGGLSDNEAIIRASKEFPCLHRLFREYNVSAFDPNPKSDPKIKHWGDANGAEEADARVVFESREYNYRDDLRWAMDQAGHYLSTGKHPETAPNGSAWFFYRQAIDEPKDFMAKFGQMEVKADAGDAGLDATRKSSKKTIDEIHSQLAELKESEEEDDGTQTQDG